MNHGSALLQLPCRRDTRVQPVHLAVPSCPGLAQPWMRLEQLLGAAAAWREEGRSQLCQWLWAEVGRAPATKREHRAELWDPNPSRGDTFMSQQHGQLQKGYPCKAFGFWVPPASTPRVAHPNRDCCGGKPAALPWKPASLFLFLLVLGGSSLLLVFTGMY